MIEWLPIRFSRGKFGINVLRESQREFTYNIIYIYNKYKCSKEILNGSDTKNGSPILNGLNLK